MQAIITSQERPRIENREPLKINLRTGDSTNGAKDVYVEITTASTKARAAYEAKTQNLPINVRRIRVYEYDSALVDGEFERSKYPEKNLKHTITIYTSMMRGPIPKDAIEEIIIDANEKLKSAARFKRIKNIFRHNRYNANNLEPLPVLVFI
ncbi:MAG: hypothetical protein ABR981_05825 [Candidatus Micrarchaeaceae archaeon]|jgi:hypothetical protein